MNYNQNDINSIVTYAKELVERTLRDLCGNDIYSQQYKGKGNFGQFLEKYYFQYEPNSLSEPDFNEVGIELKTTPLKQIRNGDFRSKERLVLNIINYFCSLLLNKSSICCLNNSFSLIRFLNLVVGVVTTDLSLFFCTSWSDFLRDLT